MVAPPSLSLLPSQQPGVSEMHKVLTLKTWGFGRLRHGGAVVPANALRVVGKGSEFVQFSGNSFWPRFGIALVAARLLPKQRRARNVARTAIGVENFAVEDILVQKLPVVQIRGPDSVLVKAAERQCVPAGVQLITEGEEDHPVFVILEGHCNVMANGSVVETYGPGDIFGEKPLLVNTEHTTPVVAATDVVLYSIDHNLVKIELRRYQALDPAGYALFVKQIEDGSPTAGDVELAGLPNLFYERRAHMLKDVEKAPWHAIAGTYVTLSSLIAMILLPFSLTSVPAWWSVSVAGAAIWVSVSGLRPRRIKRLAGMGTDYQFESIGAAEAFTGYLILRGCFDNLHMSVPPAFDGPLLHWLDLTVALAGAVAVVWPLIGVSPERDVRFVLINNGQAFFALVWFLYFLKPAWLAGTMDANVSYNLVLALIGQAGVFAVPEFLVTLHVRGLITKEQDVALQSVVFLVNFWPLIVGGLCNWTTPFDLVFLRGWIESASFSM